MITCMHWEQALQSALSCHSVAPFLLSDESSFAIHFCKTPRYATVLQIWNIYGIILTLSKPQMYILGLFTDRPAEQYSHLNDSSSVMNGYGLCCLYRKDMISNYDQRFAWTRKKFTAFSVDWLTLRHQYFAVMDGMFSILHCSLSLPGIDRCSRISLASRLLQLYNFHRGSFFFWSSRFDFKGAETRLPPCLFCYTWCALPAGRHAEAEARTWLIELAQLERHWPTFTPIKSSLSYAGSVPYQSVRPANLTNLSHLLL